MLIVVVEVTWTVVDSIDGITVFVLGADLVLGLACVRVVVVI